MQIFINSEHKSIIINYILYGLQMKPIKFISPDEFTKLFKAAKEKEMKLFLMLGFGSGMRISEIIGLPSKVSLCCKAPTVFEKRYDEARRRNIKYYVCSKCGNKLLKKDFRYSGEGWEIPPLTPDKVDLEKHQIKIDQAKGKKWRITNTPPALTEEYIKLLPLNINRRTMQFRFRKLTDEVLGRKLSPHVLRHGFGNYTTNVLKMPLPMVQSLMGHTRIDITGIYTKANPEDSVNQLWKAMGGE